MACRCFYFFYLYLSLPFFPLVVYYFFIIPACITFSASNTQLQGVGSLIEVKIADFGLSALVRIGEDGYDVEESSKRKKYKGLTEMWGTKEYFAPELIDQAYGPQADLWALGCILFEMLCGHQGQPAELTLSCTCLLQPLDCLGYFLLCQRSFYLHQPVICILPLCSYFPSKTCVAAFPIRERDNEDTFYGRIQKGEYDFSR